MVGTLDIDAKANKCSPLYYYSHDRFTVYVAYHPPRGKQPWILWNWYILLVSSLVNYDQDEIGYRHTVV